MRNPFRYFSSTDREQGSIFPPLYRVCKPTELDQANADTEYKVRFLRRCLIWRMAIDWKLEHHILEYDRPLDWEYSGFETDCRFFGHSLCTPNSSTPEDYLSENVFEPGGSIGITKNLLELFMFSVRQAEQYPAKRITYRRNSMMLVRLVLDSSILIDLVAPNTIFARKLKAKCANLHQKNFPWLLDPSRIIIDETVKARATDIYTKDEAGGRWKESELLLRECMRPCAALMDPNLTLSTMCEVNISYLDPEAHVGVLPGFTSHTRREHRSRLPIAVVYGPVEWQNTDRFVPVLDLLYGSAVQKSSKQAIRETATTVYRLITTGQKTSLRTKRRVSCRSAQYSWDPYRVH